jgi:ribose 5-phosphate isomerase B
MQKFKISIASDHAGPELKALIVQYLADFGHVITDHGVNSADSVDYPDYAAKVAQDLASKSANFGILICGTGIGMSLSANQIKGVRAASLTSEYMCQMSREHNDLNVLCLGSRVLTFDLAKRLIDIFLSTKFLGERHSKRLKKMEELRSC